MLLETTHSSPDGRDKVGREERHAVKANVKPTLMGVELKDVRRDSQDTGVPEADLPRPRMISRRGSQWALRRTLAVLCLRATGSLS